MIREIFITFSFLIMALMLGSAIYENFNRYNNDDHELYRQLRITPQVWVTVENEDGVCNINNCHAKGETCVAYLSPKYSETLGNGQYKTTFHRPGGTECGIGTIFFIK